MEMDVRAAKQLASRIYDRGQNPISQALSDSEIRDLFIATYQLPDIFEVRSSMC